ncbi:MAG: hypothetical protein U0470_09895 [Anaerolineae bacterium]
MSDPPPAPAAPAASNDASDGRPAPPRAVVLRVSRAAVDVAVLSAACGRRRRLGCAWRGRPTRRRR